MKKPFLFLFLLIAASVCKANQDFTISGHLDDLPDGTKIVLIPGALHKRMGPVDSAIVLNGNFQLKYDIPEPRLFYLWADGKGGQVTMLLAPGQNVRIEGPFAKAVVSGSPTTDELNERYTKPRAVFNAEHAALANRFSEVSKRMGEARKAKDGNAIKEIEASSEWVEYNRQSGEQARKFEERMEKITIEYRDSYWGPLLVMANTAYLTAEYEKHYNNFTDKAKETFYGKRFHEELVGVVGKAPEFKAKDTAANEIRLSEIIGRKNYVLVDFWASWCVPCRKFIPKVKELAAKYADKNMIVVSISIDTDKKAWLKAVNEEKMPWLSLLDETGINKAYGVSSIPSVYLIDPNGKVIFGKQSGDMLIKKLEEVFGK